jgi:hypothetical protein
MIQRTLSFPVGASAIGKFRAVKTATGLVVSAADTDAIVGFLVDGVAANATEANVVTFGEGKAIASGPIGAGVRICPDSAGRVKAAASGDLVCGWAESAAGADGDEINIFVNLSTVVLA